jgi:hypothetical protein
MNCGKAEAYSKKQKSRGFILCFSSTLVIIFAQPKGPTIMLEG